MGPHPEAPVDVQKYIGSYLITQQPRSKRKQGEKNHNNGGTNNHNAGTGYGGSCGSPPMSVCNCPAGIDFGYHQHHTMKNYAWTGLPLISVAHVRQKNRAVNNTNNNSGNLGNGKQHSVVQRVSKQLEYLSQAPDAFPALEDILPMSRLAIHAQGAPLIISSSDRTHPPEGKEYDDRRDLYWACSGSSHSSGSSAGSPPALPAPSSSPRSDCLDEEAHPPDLEMSRQMSPLPSDSVSTTSEDSVTSENGLPRIIKPRKRRKKDRRMGFQDPGGYDSKVGDGTIVTLKPYQPLCYGFADLGRRFAQSPPSKEYNGCDSFRSLRTATTNGTRYSSYSSPALCCCPYCVPPSATLMTPPDSPVGSEDSWTSGSRLRRSPCRMADPLSNSEIKFLPSSSPDEDTTFNISFEDAAFNRDGMPSEPRTLDSTQPPERPWIYLSERNPTSSCRFSVMCYNILCDKYATRQMYGYCPNWALEWPYRKKNILHEIRSYKADIISLQEVETEQFYHFFLPELKLDGYDGVFCPKSRAKTMSENERKHVDGCAIFFKANKFFLIKEYLVEFNQLAMANAEGSDDMLNRVMTKDNIGLAALLQTRIAAYDGDVDPSHTNQTLLVCTAHIHWDPEYSDVKLIQTMMLMHELQSIVDDTLLKCSNPNVKLDPNSIPLLLCGDFNSLPNSGVVEFLSTGHVSTKHCDFKQFAYEDCIRKLGNVLKADEFTHPFKISRAYSDDIMPFTNYSYEFKGIIDYVFYSHLHMSVLGVLGPLDSQWLQENRVQGCPHPHVPSDHFPIVVELQLLPTSPIHPPPPNGVIQHHR